LVVASSVPQSAPAQPVVPIPDDGLHLLKPGADPRTSAAPVNPSGLQLTTYQVPAAAPEPPTLEAPPMAGGAEPSPSPAPPSTNPAPAPAVSETPAAPVAPPAKRTMGKTVALYLETVGPPSQSLGRPFTYQIIVRNPGSTAVTGVRVQDELPEGARCLRTEPAAQTSGQRLEWDLGALDAGAERRLRVEVRAEREGKFQDAVTATCSVTQSVGTEIQRGHLTLTLTAPAQVKLGERVQFQVRVLNNGTGPASHVVVHDHFPAGLKHAQGENVDVEVGTLGPGESKTITLPASAVQGGRLVNQAIASADEIPDATGSATVQVDAPALVVRPTGPTETPLHREVEYRLEVANTGTTGATGVRLSGSLPEGLDFVSAGDSGSYTSATRGIDWTLGALAPGASRAVSVKVLARKPGDWVAPTLARADGGIEGKAEVKVHVEGIAALTLQVVDLDDPVEIGAETTYEIRVVNQGTGACTRVAIETVVPDGMTVVRAEPATHRVLGQRVTFEPVGRLAGRAETVFRVRVRAKTAGDWRFKAYLSCDQLQRPVYREESTLVFDGGEGGQPAPKPPAPPTGGKPEDIPRRE
jgi:uncharacterized repeat protein (TIGR01451 family)